MKQNFTSSLFVKYLYKETTAAEAKAVQTLLRESAEARQAYEELREAHQHLPRVKFNASAKTMQNILAYSKQAALENHC